MKKKIINKILIRGASSETDLHCIANALNLKINFIGSMYDLDKFTIGNYIILISPSKKIHNGHWQSLCVKKDIAFFFDSFGQAPPQIIVENIKTPIYYNNEQIQDLKSEHCGLFCVYFLYFINKYKDYNKAMKEMLKHFHIYNEF